MQFTVDTHLFRELGQFLVGRDSTALAELVKNAYDADATQVILYGESLADTSRGFIEIQDDGVGMTREEFEQGFLRIASRSREAGSRYSVRFHRRYTGAKGIGRLAAHKLASQLSVVSLPPVDRARQTRSRIQARINWDLIEQYASLGDVGADALSFDQYPAPDSAHSGTVIRLSGLRHAWPEARRAGFVSEVRGYQPPPILTQALEEALAPLAPLFSQPIARDRGGDDPGFEIILRGDFEQGDEQWSAVFSAIDWVLEIDAAAESKRIAFRMTPTRRVRGRNRAVEQHSFSIPHPEPEIGPFFQARVLLREGTSPLRRPEDQSGLYSGIRVYMEGFRVLPYGERRDDWLGLNADYNDRGDRIRALADTAFPDLLGATEHLQAEEEGHVVLPAKQYLGGIFLTQKGASSLRMVVNREGFEPNQQYDTLVESVRTGIGLLTRVRAYYSAPKREQRREARASSRTAQPEPSPATLSERTRQTLELTRTDAARVEQLARSGDAASASVVLIGSVERIQTLVATAAEVLRDQAGMLRVAASAGLQMSEFVHEIRSSVGECRLLVTELEALRHTEGLTPQQRKAVAGAVGRAESLRRSIENLARSLDDIATIDKRRRKSRQDLGAAFAEAAAFVQMAAERRSVHIESQIAERQMTCPMFRSELFSILLNVLSNAVKYAGRDGKVLASARRTEEGGLLLRVENTGTAVRPEEAERLFRPFESSSTVVDPVLGLGMGLGLPITRDLLEEYGGSIMFAAPSDGYLTAVEIVLPR